MRENKEPAGEYAIREGKRKFAGGKGSIPWKSVHSDRLDVYKRQLRVFLHVIVPNIGI